ncbi:transcriptional regulator [Bacillus sp. FJAT-27225]|uniref:helix-turn-helix domain-containing protein n=1 Tax=Bacillus sp. FJAT-27225 TaxID=1743144 RepID=UPI00080C3419|nr:helix-turn-helix domain-containing protein [Bacillus sp. FJAT-27225]OCA87859.1 transcriptional regulator [Bacillus sp. FJAT-27225]
MERANISGSRIRIARKRANLDQVDLSAALDIEFHLKLTQSDISEIERGVRGVRDYELNYIAEILGVNPVWLLRGDTKGSSEPNENN